MQRFALQQRPFRNSVSRYVKLPLSTVYQLQFRGVLATMLITGVLQHSITWAVVDFLLA